MLTEDQLMLSEDQLITEEIKIYHAIKNHRLAQLGEPALRIIGQRLGIENYLEFFFKHNTSIAEYHNKYHAICVALNAYEGAWHQQLSEDETRLLVLAAIFHDFDHSGGVKTDDKNIELAVSGVCSAYDLKMDHLLTSADLTQIIRIIQVTKYPYDNDPVTMVEKIIRDADLMQPYEEDLLVLKNQYRGLRDEINRIYKSMFTIEEFAQGQLVWLNQNVVWYSSWAKQKASALDWNKTKNKLFEQMNGA